MEYSEIRFRVLSVDKSDTLAKEVIDYAKNILEPEMKAVAPEAGFEFEDRSEFAGLDTAPDGTVAKAACSGLIERDERMLTCSTACDRGFARHGRMLAQGYDGYATCSALGRKPARGAGFVTQHGVKARRRHASIRVLSRCVVSIHSSIISKMTSFVGRTVFSRPTI